MNAEKFDADIIIVGAGMAGLIAARALAERGLRTLILEAKDHVGGRVLTQTIEGGQTVELGAEFVHGRPSELWALLDEASLATTERDGAMLRETEAGALEQDDEEEEELYSPLEQLEDFEGVDEDFASWLEHSGIEPSLHPALTGYVEGFNAADAHRIGIRALGVQQKAEEAIEGDRAWHVRGGYAQLPEYLASRARKLGAEIRLNCPVTAIRWSKSAVELDTIGFDSLRASKCIVTLPLGVLQTVNQPGSIVMQPEPTAIAHARRMAMGQVVRFTMVFREAWWLRSPKVEKDTLKRMSFLFTLHGTPSVWWTPHPEPETFPTLTGWAGGPRSEALRGKSADELSREACTALANIFGVDADIACSALKATYMHDWSSDPYTLGAYSYVPAGALDASAAMAASEADTLFFAGEHTDTTGHWGTVHAAIRSGLRVAQQVLSCIPR